MSAQMHEMHPSGGWDVHTHLIPPGVIAAAEAGRYGMRSEPGKLHICAHGVPLHSLSKVDALIARVNADRLDGAIVSVPPPLFRPDLGDGERMAYAQLVNDSLLRVCETYRPTLRPFAYLPIESPELAARIAASLGGEWAGVVAGTELAPLSYASDRYDALWHALGEAGLPLFIHPGSTPDVRLDPFYLTNLLGNPVETTIAAANLVFAGVMQRFPRLKVILAHGGGCVAALCGRWQRGHATDRPGIDKQMMPPEQAVRRFYVDSLVHSAPMLRAIIEILGDDRILLGSDWPFPMGAPSAGHDLSVLDAATIGKIRKANAEAVFGRRLRS
jgi:aminocarboxymuconate-semialdehyde decarboxylase